MNDTNYIFLTFVTRYLPAGLAGLVLAVIFGPPCRRSQPR